MKFGDIVVNGWASENNPHRTGIFVRSKGKTIQLTDGKGTFWETYNDKESQNQVVGSMLKEEQPEPTDTVDTLKEHYTDHTTKLLNKIYGEEEEGK